MFGIVKVGLQLLKKLLTCTIGVVRPGRERRTTGMTRTKVRQPVVAADRFHVKHVTFAAKVARRRQVHLERLHVVLRRRAVVVRYRRASHFEILTTQEEQQPVTGQTDQVGDKHKLDGPLRLQLEPLQDATTDEDSDASARHGDRPREDTGLTLAQAELSLEVLWQEHHESGHDHQLHARPQAGHDVHRIGHQPPHGQGNVYKKIL